MIEASTHPRCTKRLQINFTNMNDPLMNDYWAAVIVADFCDDEALEDFGGFDFDDRSAGNGRNLLDRLEVCIAQKRHRIVRLEVPSGLVAMLGARGIKTSMLKTEGDYWSAAMTLFPGILKRKAGLYALHSQIVRIPKKERKRLADENLKKVKAEWLSSAQSHQRKLQ
ncbi:hypothetical protein PCC82_04685 [Agrobacterium deltaense]